MSSHCRMIVNVALCAIMTSGCKPASESPSSSQKAESQIVSENSQAKHVEVVTTNQVENEVALLAASNALITARIKMERNYKQTVEWLKNLARQNDRDACFVLGQMYRDGYGVTQDLKESRHWFSIAADRGDLPSQKALEALPMESDASSPENTVQSSLR